MLRFLMCILSLLIMNVGLAAPLKRFIIDTDVAPDDVIAILYLLKQPSVRIEAITIESMAMRIVNPHIITLKKFYS